MNPQQLIIFQTIINEINSSSDEEALGSDTEDHVLNVLINNNRRRERVSRVYITNYVEDVVHRYTDSEFKSHFRLSRVTFQFLLELLNSQLSKQEAHGPGRRTISAEKTLLLALWMLATSNCYRFVSDHFGVSKATAWRSVHKVVDALYARRHTFIGWPDRQKAEEIWTNLKNQYGFPNVIGAIDGTHIQIAAPKLRPEAYVNRKGYHSIHLQIVCDHSLKTTHSYSGEVGSVHDMTVFKRSGFENMCRPQNFPEESHLLGDAAYAIQKYVMVPFKDNGHLTDSQRTYNYRLSATRMIVERTIGMLKARFRSLLDTLPMKQTDLIPKYIIACCILHNICQMRNDIINLPIFVQQNPVEGRNVLDAPETLRLQGIEKRNAIVYYLQNENNEF